MIAPAAILFFVMGSGTFGDIGPSWQPGRNGDGQDLVLCARPGRERIVKVSEKRRRVNTGTPRVPLSARVPCGKEASTMRRTVRFASLIAVVVLLAACGDDGSSSNTSSDTTINGTTTDGTTTETVVTTTSAPATTTTGPATTTTEATLAQPAIWPAADVVFTTPEAAAADFASNVLGEGSLLGDFMGGDQRSGEIEVFASVDGAPIGDARSTLFLRQLGPSDGWFVLAAANALNTITAPESMSEVPAGPTVVEGVGQGFEATIVVSAIRAGHADVEFDRVVAMAGNFGEVLPYSVTLDLSAASPGDTVVVMVRGGTGLETDPGDFTAIPILIG
jgi:hypothetical protein